MTETAGASMEMLLGRSDDRDAMADPASRYTVAALERHKREGLELAVRARWIALAIVAVLLPILNFRFEVIWYEGGLLVLAGIGWLQRRVGQVGQSRVELLVLFLDLAFATALMTVPNPLAVADADTPSYIAAFAYRYENFIYLFIILAGGTLAYSWRTIYAIGTWTAALWLIAAVLVGRFGATVPELTDAARAAFGSSPRLLDMLDPNSVMFQLRVQEVVVFFLVAATLGITVRRYNNLLLGNAALERERENLSRYFSPNVVEQLSRNDEPLKQIRTHDAAVLFVDIVGFTEFAASRRPEEVIETLRAFHGQMEDAVFRHGGTLDKYLGDGLMATFGTPMAKEQDACDALLCARAMIRAVAEWNRQRAVAGEVPIRLSIGLHYGPVVLGDIGTNRLEFAVIGNTVNIASRLERLTRPLGAQLVVSDAARRKAAGERGAAEVTSKLAAEGAQQIRGLGEPISVWSFRDTGALSEASG